MKNQFNYCFHWLVEVDREKADVESPSFALEQLSAVERMSYKVPDMHAHGRLELFMPRMILSFDLDQYPYFA